MSDLFKVPDWSLVKNPYEYVYYNTQSVLITAGDSWTYGDSLGNTKVREGRDDKRYRLEHVYGFLMSRDMGVSWINLALPGISNSLMIQWVDQLLTTRRMNHNTTCVITLTESGRHEDMRLMDRSLITQQRVLEKLTLDIYGQITILMLKYPEVKFLVAHNFTDCAGDLPCKQTWLEVMLGRPVQNGTHIVVSEHIGQMNYDARFPDVLDIMDRAAARMDLLDSCDFCYKEDSRHPNEHGHRLWANYLLGQI